MAATVTATMAVLEVPNWATIEVSAKGNRGRWPVLQRHWNLGASFLFWSFSGAPRGWFHFIPVCAAHSGGIAGQQPASN